MNVDHSNVPNGVAALASKKGLRRASRLSLGIAPPVGLSRRRAVASKAWIDDAADLAGTCGVLDIRKVASGQRYETSPYRLLSQ